MPRPFLTSAAALAAGCALGERWPRVGLPLLAAAAGLALGLCVARRGGRSGVSLALLALLMLAQALRVGARPQTQAPPSEGRLEILRAGDGGLLARL
ncbi:MAG TPA: hypothetical protein VMT18_13080, partial [Planctomycetota bacterium]|nr:hypothetical protein [Planctomycetota bacterium]